MSAAVRRALVVVGDDEPSPAEAILRSIVPALINAEAAAAKLRLVMAVAGRDLAKERGLVFIRPEQLRAEFASGD